jgi:8-oxo-dGTP pyrophosphatase MutT (NUDIX family)
MRRKQRAPRCGDPRTDDVEASSGERLRLQYGALPIRFAATGAMEVLLVTSRTTRRWVIPKGWPMKGAKPAEAAAREAFEEAGVRGRIAAEPLGTYAYRKRDDDHKHPAVACRVRVFVLQVKRQATRWPERHERETCWFEAKEAAARVDDAGMRDLIEALAATHGGRHAA